MKKFLLLFFTVSLAMAQENANISLGAYYSYDVFYKLSNGESSSYERANWDVAFYRVSPFDQGIRLNEGKGLKLYEASTDINDWDQIDASDLTVYQPLHNSDESWSMGAFNFGSAVYGWGEYNMNNHHVIGTTIFLIENTIDQKIYKFMIEDYFGAYTIKFALWNGTNWEADQNMVVSNSDNPDKFFNYINLDTKLLVQASPAMDQWDLKFTKYSTPVPTNTGETVAYTVTGVLQNPNVTIAKVEESKDADFADTNKLVFSENINSIGYNWKKLNSNWKYELVENKVFYIKSENIIYRMFFTSFEGSSTGNLSFQYAKQKLSTLDIQGNTQFAIYPNPVINKEVTIVYDNAKNLDSNIQVEIYNLTGQKVYSTSLNRQTGLFQRTLKLNKLAQGVYIMNIVAGSDVKSEKLIIK